MRFSVLIYPLCALLAVASACSASAKGSAETTHAKQALNALFDTEWQRGLQEDPLGAVYYGDFRFNDRLPDLSADAIASRREANQKALTALHAIDRAALSPNDQLNYDVFGWELAQSIALSAFHPEQIPLNQRGGIQTFDETLELLRFEKEKDYADWVARLRGFGTYMDQTIALMQAGIDSGRLPPKVTMQRVVGQIERQLADSAEESRFWAPFERFPASVPSARHEALQAQGKAAIEEVVLPAYRRFHAFFTQTYLPACRDDIAVASQPEGRAQYAALARYFTTTELTPDEIHDIGLREVERIRAEMESVRKSAGFEGDLAAFFTYLRTDPKFFYSTPEALLDGYRAISKRIDPELVKVFRTLPRMPYGVRAIPDHVAPDTTTAYYMGAALDGSRAGYYYVNLYKPETRPKWEMMALSLHEAVPGHHFQFAYAMELPEQPQFRRVGYIVAYGEGWGLYAEQLGYDMGLYDDPYDRMGQLAYDMWRAVRLVVDTGMHVKGWSRQQAIDFFMANSPKTEQDVVNEIDRYIAWPGQALAYKIGQLKISELRERAHKALGERFDLKAFHDVVLGTGSVPLVVLESRVDAWITAQGEVR